MDKKLIEEIIRVDGHPTLIQMVNARLCCYVSICFMGTFFN